VTLFKKIAKIAGILAALLAGAAAAFDGKSD